MTECQMQYCVYKYEEREQRLENRLKKGSFTIMKVVGAKRSDLDGQVGYIITISNSKLIYVLYS